LSAPSEAVRRPFVYLVGAGPGDPGLLTLRAVECLRQADYVLHDYLTSPRLLDFVSPHATFECVDQLPGDHPQRWPVIHRRIIDEAKLGKVVVHLKGGDPLIFGRGGEEAEALREAGIPYEIVPGVTSAFAAGAYAEIPLTHREHASAIAIVTGHEHPGKSNSRLDWGALTHFPGTLAVYMGVARLGSITRELIKRGKPPETPVALVHQASLGEQLTVTGTLGEIEEKVRLAGIASPSLVLIGAVAGLKPETSWFEARPLIGMRVLITRPRRQSSDLIRRLELLGAVPFLMSAIEPAAPADWQPVDDAIHALKDGRFATVVFTSANGVDFFLGRIKTRNLDLRVFGSVQLACIGRATAAKLAEYHLRPDLVPPDDFRSESLAELLKQQASTGPILLAQAAEARDTLRLRLAGVAEVHALSVYSQRDAIVPDSAIFDHLRRGEIHAVTLTSPNIATAFLDACDATILDRFRSGHTVLISNSPRLSAMLSQRGLESQTSADPTVESLIARLIETRAANVKSR
jgi:uroporphyrinogen III methyltransferase / synthase